MISCRPGNFRGSYEIIVKKEVIIWLGRSKWIRSYQMESGQWRQTLNPMNNTFFFVSLKYFKTWGLCCYENKDWFCEIKLHSNENIWWHCMQHELNSNFIENKWDANWCKRYWKSTHDCDLNFFFQKGTLEKNLFIPINWGID